MTLNEWCSKVLRRPILALPWDAESKRDTERLMERKKRNGFYFSPEKIGRLFFTLLCAFPDAMETVDTQLRGKSGKEQHQLVPIIDPGICVFVPQQCFYRKQTLTQTPAYCESKGSWHARKCLVKMPVQYVHHDWRSAGAPWRVEHSQRKKWSQKKIPTVKFKTNKVWAVAALQLRLEGKKL